MTKDDALKLALEALEEAHYKHEHRQDATKRGQAITAIEAALAQPSDSVKQEPVNIVLDSWDAWASSTEYDNKNHDLLSALKDIRKALALTSTTCEVQPEQGQGIKGYAMALNEVSLKLRKRYEQDLIATPLWTEFEKARNRLARSVAQPERSQFGSPEMQVLILANLAQTSDSVKQEPVGTFFVQHWRGLENQHFDADGHGLPDGEYKLYTTPPKRQPLTDEQIADYLGDTYFYMTQFDLKFFKLGEKAAHGIKELNT